VYEVRVLENGLRKIKIFENCKNPSQASSKYDGNGEIISVRKLGYEKLFSVGQFFRLGDDIIRSLKQDDLSSVAQVRITKGKERNKIIKRMNNNRRYNGE
jgi:hypothetical protein